MILFHVQLLGTHGNLKDFKKWVLNYFFNKVLNTQLLNIYLHKKYLSSDEIYRMSKPPVSYSMPFWKSETVSCDNTEKTGPKSSNLGQLFFKDFTRKKIIIIV